MKRDLLLDKPHWEVGSPKEFEAFFDALLQLVPEGSVLCLGGYPDEERRSLVEGYALPNPDRIPLIEFAYGEYLQIDENNLQKLHELASCHAEPEIATHIAVTHKDRQILEWFDAPFDPISVSLEIPEDKVKRFCGELGVKYENSLGSK